ncbi:hypothetical protein NUW54_g12900 [Trametes sanguinea]|uniref:Uncharacterized protein n=1 Tax=Trametes sanguinea TaxID=158606 RepID=A0ACC1MSA1_9APHY|nr:hypothetical protein NUW54_g12900 [Trametes sanguinea]
MTFASEPSTFAILVSARNSQLPAYSPLPGYDAPFDAAPLLPCSGGENGRAERENGFLARNMPRATRKFPLSYTTILVATFTVQVPRPPCPTSS